MSRIAGAFSRMRSEGRKGLVAYLTAGDPTPKASLQYLLAAAEGGADILEVGVPFSDPMADGPTIQKASRRALDSGTSLARVLELVHRVRKSVDIPIVMFGYFNPFLQYGIAALCRDCREAGADGVLVVDLPIEEAGEMLPDARREGLDWIPLASPTSGEGRIKRASASGSGFLYLISVTGITGARTVLPAGLSGWVRTVKRLSSLPVAVGFGISTPEMARAAARHADAAVVGSACVRIVERHGTGRAGPSALKSFVESLTMALR